MKFTKAQIRVLTRIANGDWDSAHREKRAELSGADVRVADALIAKGCVTVAHEGVPFTKGWRRYYSLTDRGWWVVDENDMCAYPNYRKYTFNFAAWGM